MSDRPLTMEELRQRQLDLATDVRTLLVALSQSAPPELIHAVYDMLQTETLKEALAHDHPYLRYKKPNNT